MPDHHTKSRLLGGIATALLAAALLLTACGGAPPPATPATLSVVTSTNVYGSIAKSVGGDRVSVSSLITDPAADPHSFEATPADTAKVAQARVIVFNGGGYDDFVPKLVEATGTGDRKVIDVVELSGLKPAADEGFNEHVWYNVPTVEKLTAELAGAFAAADPAGAATYRANAATYTTTLNGLRARTDAIAAAHRGARVAVTEPVPGYLIEAAGLTDATPPEFAEAVEEDTDPAAAVVQQTLALFGSDPVRVLIVNSQTETPTTKQVELAAQTGGVPVVDVSETLPEGTDYAAWMGGQIDALAAALAK